MYTNNVDKIKQELVSILITFASSFLLAVGASLESTGGVQWTSAMLISLLLAAGRSALKAVMEKKALEIAGAPKK